MSKFTTAILAASAALVLATPSFAGETQGTKVKIVERNGQTMYCIRMPVTTGSIMNHRSVCKTREAWAEDGVTIAANEPTDKLAANPQTASQN